MWDFIKEDGWISDFVVSEVFAVGMATIFEIASQSGKLDIGQILTSIVLATVAYAAAFFLGILLRKLIRNVVSWIWIAIVGAFFYSVVQTLVAIPVWLKYYRDFYSKSELAQSEFLFRHVPWTLSYWAIWAVLGGIFLVSVRWAFTRIRGNGGLSMR